MKKRIVVAATVLALASVASPAVWAGTPAWCGSGKFDANSEDVRTISTSKDVHELVPAIASALCTTNPDIDPHRGEIEAVRQAVGPKLGMADADWADAAA